MIILQQQVNIVNLVKFIVLELLVSVVLELLVSVVLEPAWELFISRTAHARLKRGERVPLSTLPKSRTFPCALVSGRRTAAFALALSLTTLGGSLGSEYAIDAVTVTHESNDRALIYSRGAGPGEREHDNDDERAPDVAAVATVMADRCYYRHGDSYYVNASFANNTAITDETCVTNDADERFQVSDVCIMTKTEAETSLCLWDQRNTQFVVQRIGERSAGHNRHIGVVGDI